MNKMVKKIILIIILILFIGVIAGAVILYDEIRNDFGNTILENELSNNSENNKTPATDIIITNYDGEEVKLSSLYGKPIVINFWASWCPPCEAELPEFDEVYKEMGDDVNFIMLNMTDPITETVEKVKEFIVKGEYTFPVYFDESGEASRTYQIYALPTTMIIDRDGNIDQVVRGQITENKLRSMISDVI